MSARPDRRSFLQSLIALGAAYALPADASEERVREVWQEALDAPWVFHVDGHGTISDPDCAQAEVWGDVFEDIWPQGIEGPEDVIYTVERCQPLLGHFKDLAERALEDLRDLLTEDLTAHQLALMEALQDPDEGWYDWVRLGGDAGVQHLREAISDWLQEPVDHLKSEWFPMNHGATGQAKGFFESLGWDLLKTLGVVIVEGEHPGSTYYAAELRQPIDKANEVAILLELPFRFQRKG